MNLRILSVSLLMTLQAAIAHAMAPRSQPDTEPVVPLEELVIFEGRYDFLRQIDNGESQSWGVTCEGVHRRGWMELVVTQNDVQIHPTGIFFAQVNQEAQTRDVRRSELDPRMVRYFNRSRLVQATGSTGEPLLRVIRESKTCSLGIFGLEAGCNERAFTAVDQVVIDPQRRTLTIPGSEGFVRRPTCVYQAALRRP